MQIAKGKTDEYFFSCKLRSNEIGERSEPISSNSKAQRANFAQQKSELMGN